MMTWIKIIQSIDTSDLVEKANRNKKFLDTEKNNLVMTNNLLFKN